jgi:serine/alanine adding enzyme
MLTTAAQLAGIRIARAGEGDMAAWSRRVAELPGARLAHAPEWFTVIRNAYGHEPLYLEGEDGDGRLGVLPAFVVRRPLRRAVVSSMPFLDGGGACGTSTRLVDALNARLFEEARRLGADRVEVRSAEPAAAPFPHHDHKVNVVLSLPPDSDRLWRGLDGRVRNQVRKAERSGLSVEFAGAEALDEFHAILSARLHELASPVHAPAFYAEVLAAFGGAARIAVVRKGSMAVGSLLALGFKDTLVVPWASCLRSHAALCPNMLLYWETIRRACALGFRRFDFGRSTRDSGTHRFKRQWGAVDEPLYWYGAPASAHGASSVFTRAWRRLPLRVTRRLGPHVRRYLTQ